MLNNKTMQIEHSKKQSAFQKGFTFVELLVIMVIIAIIGGIGIQFVLSTQEDKAKLTNARTFLGKDIPTALYSVMAREGDVADVTKAKLLIENVKGITEWDEDWELYVGTTSAGKERVIICYPMATVGESSDSVGADLFEYLEEKTTWDDEGIFAYMPELAGTAGRTTDATSTGAANTLVASSGIGKARNANQKGVGDGVTTDYCKTEFNTGGKRGFMIQYDLRR
jgi:prepilin-type N-terminal cleavage/methylation domain-containing protein